jgi:hypothetical protein
MSEAIFGYSMVGVIILIAIITIKVHEYRNPKPKKREKPIKPVISKDPVIDETPIKLNEDPRYKDFINAQWDEMNK